MVSKAVDFSFINELLEGSDCKNFGRTAKESEMMMKLLFMAFLYSLSDAIVYIKMGRSQPVIDW